LEMCRKYHLGVEVPERGTPEPANGPVFPPCQLVDCNPGAPGPLIDELTIEFDPRHFASVELEVVGSSTHSWPKPEYGIGRTTYRQKNLFAGVNQLQMAARTVLRSAQTLKEPLDAHMEIRHRAGKHRWKKQGIRVALVPCGSIRVERIPIAVQDLALEQDIEWPMLASIPLPQGKIPLGQLGRWTLEENGEWIPAQLDSVSVWPDSSYKWVHVHFNANYEAGCGRWERYELVRKVRRTGTMHTLQNGPLLSTYAPATLAGNPSLSITNEALEFKVLNDEITISHKQSNNTYKCIASMVSHEPGDFEGKALSSSRLDSIALEQQGPLQCVVRVSGRYADDDTTHHRFITRYYISTLGTVKVEHATIFTGNMGAISANGDMNNRAQDIGFHLVQLNGHGHFTSCRSGIEGSSSVQYPIVPDRPISLHQISDTTYRFNSATDRRKGRSAGWMHVTSGATGGDLLLLTKDIWQKYPKEIILSDDSLSFYSWPKNGVDDFGTLDEINDSSLYKFLCFHSGDTLDLMIPDEYILNYNERGSGINSLPMCAEEHEADGEAIEMRVKHVNESTLPDRGPEQGDAIGVALFNEFTLCFGRSAQAAPASAQLVQKEPIAMPTQEHSCATKVFGDVAPRVKGQYDDIEETIIMSPMAFSDPAVTRNYGMWNYGDQNESWLPVIDRPSYHRVWFNNHYQFMHSMWQTYAVRFDADRQLMGEFLGRTRAVTDHYSSVDFVWHSASTAGTGRFRHTRGPTHWGNKTDVQYNNHGTDPAGLRLAWAVGGDRWCKEAYMLWRNETCGVNGVVHTDDQSPGQLRHLSQNYFNIIDAFNWDPSFASMTDCTQPSQEAKGKLKESLDKLIHLSDWKGWTKQCSTAVGEDHSTQQATNCCTHTGVEATCCTEDGAYYQSELMIGCATPIFWNPLWPEELHGFDPGYAAPVLDTIQKKWDNEGIGTYHKNASPALAALLATEHDRPDLLTRFFYLFSKYPLNVFRDPGHTYHGFGIGPGDLGDMHYPVQWPYYLKAIRDFNVRIPSKDWIGQYPSGTFNLLVVDTMMKRDSLDLSFFKYLDNTEFLSVSSPITTLFEGHAAFTLVAQPPSLAQNDVSGVPAKIHSSTTDDDKVTSSRLLSSTAAVEPTTMERSKCDIVRIPLKRRTPQCEIRVINMNPGHPRQRYNAHGLPEAAFLKGGPQGTLTLHSGTSYLQPIGDDTVTITFTISAWNSNNVHNGHNLHPTSIRLIDRYDRERLNKSYLAGATTLTDTVELDQASAPFRWYVNTSYDLKSSVTNVNISIEDINCGVLVAAKERDLCELLNRLVPDSPYRDRPCE